MLKLFRYIHDVILPVIRFIHFSHSFSLFFHFPFFFLFVFYFFPSLSIRERASGGENKNTRRGKKAQLAYVRARRHFFSTEREKMCVRARVRERLLLSRTRMIKLSLIPSIIIRVFTRRRERGRDGRTDISRKRRRQRLSTRTHAHTRPGGDCDPSTKNSIRYMFIYVLIRIYE